MKTKTLIVTILCSILLVPLVSSAVYSQNTIIVGNGGNQLKMASSSSAISALAGGLSIASSSPWGLLSVNPNGITGPSFVVGSSTATSFVVTNGSLVGIGNAAPGVPLSFSQTTGKKILLYPTTATTGYGFGVAGGLLQIFADSGQRVGIGTEGFTETLSVTATNVGVGSTTPWARLGVKGASGAFSSSLLNVGSSTNATLFNINGAGQQEVGGPAIAAPTSCGGSPAVTTGSVNTAGEITQGTVSTGCVITFNPAYVNAPFCVVTEQAGLGFSYVTTNTAITITNIGALSSTKMNWHCSGNDI